jgi:hypothetical protein
MVCRYAAVDRFGRLTVCVLVRPTSWVLALVVLMYVGAWALSFGVGGASTVPPHAFYLPVAVIGVKLGLGGAIVAGVVAALLAGPALPAEVSTNTAQATSDWVSRGVFFVVIGSAVAQVTRSAIGSAVSVTKREAELYRAVSSDELVLLYQPVVRIDTGAVVGVEALVRWRHPQRGMLGPQEFIPFAEDRGMIEAIGNWVLSRAVSDIRGWSDAVRDRPFPIRELAVNMSRRQFSESASVFEQLDELTNGGRARARPSGPRTGAGRSAARRAPG